MGRKELLWAGARASLLVRPSSTCKKDVILQHYQPLVTRHFSAQSGGGRQRRQQQQRGFKRCFSRTFSAVGKEVCGIPYFPVVLGFAVSGCLGAGLLVVYADGESHGPPSISNSGG